MSSADLDLPPLLKEKLTEYRKARAFDPAEWTEKKVGLFMDYMRKCGLKAAVVSVSGGIDSAVTLALINRAKNTPNSPVQRVLGISQPIHSSAWALNRAKEAATALGVELAVIDQTEIHSQLQQLVDKAVNIEGNSYSTGQLRSYMRTPVGYYTAQLLSQQGTPCVVMGTGNRDEDGYLAYFCKAGDGVVDVQLIADLHKSEVFQVGAYLGVPKSILEAPPSADLWAGQTDEEELGFSYDFIELFTGWYLQQSEAEQAAFRESMDEESRRKFETWATKCEEVHQRNRHKFNSPVNLNVYDVPAVCTGS